jgi:hypothetical protein
MQRKKAEPELVRGNQLAGLFSFTYLTSSETLGYSIHFEIT